MRPREDVAALRQRGAELERRMLAKCRSSDAGVLELRERVLELKEQVAEERTRRQQLETQLAEVWATLEVLQDVQNDTAAGLRALQIETEQIRAEMASHVRKEVLLALGLARDPRQSPREDGHEWRDDGVLSCLPG